MIDAEALKQALGDLEEEDVRSLLDEFLAGDPSVEEANQIVEACQKGMEIVGDHFEEGTYFVGDLMYAAQILTGSLDRIKPIMDANINKTVKGIIVLGTVSGDIHDIGKNIFKALAEAAGFTVVDIGIDQPASAFIDAIKVTGAKIVGLSGVLTLSIASMKEVIEGLKTAGFRSSVKVVIGGNAVSAEACEFVGADFWSKNAAASVKKCLEYSV
jgi:methanogenic corrinoid protein MtbC1